MIETADLVETEEWGRVLAVDSDAFLNEVDEIYLQVGEGYFDIVQSGVVKGHIESVPTHVLEPFFDDGVLTIVRVGRDRIDGIYAARVQDIMISDEDYRELDR